MSEAEIAAPLPAGSLLATEARAYYAPVDRTSGMTVPFDPSSMGGFALNTPPAGWIDGGRVLDFSRSSGSAVLPIRSGSPAVAKTQARAVVEEEVQFTFAAWTRMSLALSSGAQIFNLLRPASGSQTSPSGATQVVEAEPVLAGSTATVLQLGANTSVQAGDLIAVDEDYAGQTGYLGAGIPGAYVGSAPLTVDPHYLRRVSFNVGRVAAVNAGVVTLSQALPAGVPAASMKAGVAVGFVDRAGGGYLQEWSGLFVFQGAEGDRLLMHYPRLQPVGASPAEMRVELADGVDRWRPCTKLRAMPVSDPNDGTLAVCFRTYLPASARTV